MEKNMSREARTGGTAGVGGAWVDGAESSSGWVRFRDDIEIGWWSRGAAVMERGVDDGGC